MNVLQQKIGIIGGGQLGKMMILEAKKLDFYVIILDPVSNCPAHSIADEHIIADFDDESALRKLAEKSDILTYEFEHIGVNTLLDMEEEGYTIYPTIESLKIIQNKFTQKQTLVDHQIEVPKFLKVENINDIKRLGDELGYPLILKSCYGGYDGKGNAVIEHQDDISLAFDTLNGDQAELMIEEFINYSCEISVIAARDIGGNISTFPIGENIHEDNILIETMVPARIDSKIAAKAKEVGHAVLEVFNGVGIFCIEMFVTNTGSILVNEIAPRPHNSGHYTIEACVTSQFAQHVRAITGLPLGDTTLLAKSVMRNIIGDVGPTEAIYSGLSDSMRIKKVHPHIYGKFEVRPGRKMGHITVIGDDLPTIREKAKIARDLISFRT